MPHFKMDAMDIYTIARKNLMTADLHASESGDSWYKQATHNTFSNMADNKK